MKRYITVPFCALCYTYVGVLLWLMEWVRPLFSVPVIGLGLIGLYLFAKDPTDRGVVVTKPVFVLCAVLLIVWTILCGSGGFFVQTVDWDKHNAILRDLILKEWPVYYHNDDSSAMLTYYLGQYLVPAAAGKLTNSFRVGELAMAIWNFTGVFLTTLMLFRVVGADTWRKQVFTLFTLIFFSAVLFLSRAVYAATSIGVNDVPDVLALRLGSIYVHFRSNLNVFRWIPTNGPPAWIATALFAEHLRSPKYYLLFLAPLLLCASFPFLGLALLMFGLFAVHMALPSTKNSERLHYWKECFSVPNLCAFAVLILEIVYLVGNTGGVKPAEAGFALVDFGTNALIYFCLCLGFAVYSAVIFPVFQRTPLYYIVNASLFLFPFFKYGLLNDLCMNASIPALFLLMSFVIQGMFQFTAEGRPSYGRATILMLLLVWGAIYPVLELKDSCASGPDWNGTARFSVSESMNDYARRDGSVRTDLAYNYYTYDYEESLFYVWFAKDK